MLGLIGRNVFITHLDRSVLYKQAESRATSCLEYSLYNHTRVHKYKLLYMTGWFTDIVIICLFYHCCILINAIQNVHGTIIINALHCIKNNYMAPIDIIIWHVVEGSI